MRLLWQLATMKGDALKPALFLTLTYPAGEFEPRETKRHLELFFKRLKRRWPAAAAMWKLEYTQAGTAHYHVLVLGVDFWAKEDVSRCWAEVVRSRHPKHEMVGTQVQMVVSQRQAAHYMGKYISKGATVPENHFGRVWGVVGDLERFRSTRVLIGLDRNQLVQLRRVFDAIRKSHAKRPFKRRSDLSSCQRWFMEGSSAVAVAGRLFDLDLSDLADPPPLTN